MDYSLFQNWSNVKTLFHDNSQAKKLTLSTSSQGAKLQVSKQAWRYFIEKE